MKIGILTFHRAVNYGALLQSWALQTFLKEIGYNSSIIDYKCQAIDESYKLFSWKKFFQCSMYSKLLYILNHISHWRGIKNRNEKFDEFRTTSLCLTRMEAVSEIDTVICGSDQIWNPYLTGGLDDIYTMADHRFSGKRKIAYAISGEPKYLSKKEVVTDILAQIKTFSAISFREPDLVEMFMPYYHGNIECCVDPTFLINKEQWDIFSSDEPIIKERYIFIYQVVYSKDCISLAKRIAKEKGLNIYFLNSSFKFGRREKNIQGQVGPKEFVNLIKNAEFIITTSFHGTALSIIMNKQFLFVPTGTNNRQIKLLKALNLEDRIAESVSNHFQCIEYKNVPIKSYANSSREFLLRNLSIL